MFFNIFMSHKNVCVQTITLSINYIGGWFVSQSLATVNHILNVAVYFGVFQKHLKANGRVYFTLQR